MNTFNLAPISKTKLLDFMFQVVPDLAPMLWHSFGTMAALLQEIINIYPAINPPVTIHSNLKSKSTLPAPFTSISN